MASIISAGTTSNTALNLSADTTGVLQLATNGTTTAITVDTSQNVGIGTASPAATLDVTHSNGGRVRIRGVSADGARLEFFNNAATTNGFLIGQGYSSGSDNVAYISNQATADLILRTAATERMRITSIGNVGIGTSSPTQQLTVGGSGNILVAAGGTVFSSGRLYIRSGSGQPFDFGANDTNSLMQLASSGSLGLGATPSAWSVIAPGFDIGPCGGMGSFTNQFDMLYNLYYDGSQFRYKTTNTGLLYRQLSSDGHVFETCPSGSAGAVAGFTRKASINDFGIGLGAVTPTSGMGITFPATQDPSSNVNCLDDYEEGTFTPTITATGGAFASVTYVTQLGKYTKIGDTVFITLSISWSAASGGSGDVRIAGLPFSAADGYTSMAMYQYINVVSDLDFQMRTNANTQLAPQYLKGASGVNVVNFNSGSFNKSISVAGCYKV